MVVLAMIPGSQFGFSQSKKGTGQVALEGSLDLEASADRALQFFTPEGERAWVKDWNPEPVYPPQAGVAFQTNAVFRVDEDTEDAGLAAYGECCDSIVSLGIDPLWARLDRSEFRR
jgi:hypothetical protein